MTTTVLMNIGVLFGVYFGVWWLLARLRRDLTNEIASLRRDLTDQLSALNTHIDAVLRGRR